MSFARRVIHGTGAITLANGVARILAFLTVPLVSPLLGPEPYGVAALVGTVVSIASVLGLLGIDMGYTRFYLQEDALHRIQIERFCWRFAATGALGLSFLVGIGWYEWGGHWLRSHKDIAGYSAAAVLLSILVTMATTRVRLLGDYRRIALALCLGSFFSAFFTVGAALYWRTDVWVLLLGGIIASLITLLVLRATRADLFSRPTSLGLGEKHAVVMLGLAGSVTAPMYWLISSADRWFIVEYGNVGEVGVYGMAASIASVSLMLNSSLTLTWFPEASRHYGDHGEAALASLGQMWARLVVGLAITWVAVSAAGGDLLRLLAAPQFHHGAEYIPWLAGGVFFYGLASLANTSLFLEAKMRYSAYVWLVGGGFCLLVNFLLVPRLGAYGAAMAQCLSYGVTALGTVIMAQRVMSLSVPWPRLSSALLIAFCFGVVMKPPWVDLPIFSLLYKLPVGVLMTACLLWLIAPDWFGRILTLLVWNKGQRKI
jgi:O-antigen/teichoic acid export membrane protein